MLAALAGFLVYHFFLSGGPSRTDLSLTQFRSRLSAGSVRDVTLLDKDHVLHGTLANGTSFAVRFPAGYTGTLTGQIVAARVGRFHVDTQQESPWVGLALNILPFVLVLGLVAFLLHHAQGARGVTSFGRARA